MEPMLSWPFSLENKTRCRAEARPISTFPKPEGKGTASKETTSVQEASEEVALFSRIQPKCNPFS